MTRRAALLLALGAGLSLPARADPPDPTACVGEVERVCIHLEDHLETCLAERGAQLSPACRDQVQTAMSMAQDPSGPAACVPDVQRLCPGLKTRALAQCITNQQANFSADCRKYLQNAPPAKPAE